MPVRAVRCVPTPAVSTPSFSSAATRKAPNSSAPTRVMSPARTPSRASPTATLAGAPPTWRSKRSTSRSSVPRTSGKKSTITSPNERTSTMGQLLQELERAERGGEVGAEERVQRLARRQLGRGRGRARGGVGEAARADEQQPLAGLGGERPQRAARITTVGGAGQAEQPAARRVEDGPVERR